MALNLLVVCNAVTTNINQRIPAGKKTFSCKFKIVHDYVTINLRSLLCMCGGCLGVFGHEWMSRSTPPFPQVLQTYVHTEEAKGEGTHRCHPGL